MEDVVVLVLEEEGDEAAEEFGVFDGFEDFLA